VPLEEKVVRMYTCGVTVYDQCHIGHGRSLYIFDVIRRYLQFRGYDVHFIRNITDIDDKIINRAQELQKSWETVVQENIDAYKRDLKALRIDEADVEPRATENIESIQRDITGLIAKGYAYEVDGDVYFRVRQFKRYGQLSGQSIEKMLEAVRIEPDAKKADPLDFALWKKSKENEPGWPSPWGTGRPGWHIECSCMSLKHLQCRTLDIHAGGRDLIFPHHENEIAQAEPLTGKPFAQYWIHHGLLTINGQKMAKSLGNFITIQEALKTYRVDALKMFFLASHYASAIDFSDERMKEASKAVEKISILLKRVEPFSKTKSESKLWEDPSLALPAWREKFSEAMDDDFNTPKALACLFDFVSETHRFIDTHQRDRAYHHTITAAGKLIEQWCHEIFGLLGDDASDKPSEEQERLLQERQEARRNKDFRRSDELRDLLREKGCIVEDTKEGQSWRRG